MPKLRPRKSSCPICKKNDNSDMVCCDGPCNQWHHFNCVSIQREIAERMSEWWCNDCLSHKEQINDDERYDSSASFSNIMTSTVVYKNTKETEARKVYQHTQEDNKSVESLTVGTIRKIKSMPTVEKACKYFDSLPQDNTLIPEDMKQDEYDADIKKAKSTFSLAPSTTVSGKSTKSDLFKLLEARRENIRQQNELLQRERRTIVQQQKLIEQDQHLLEEAMDALTVHDAGSERDSVYTKQIDLSRSLNVEAKPYTPRKIKRFNDQINTVDLHRWTARHTLPKDLPIFDGKADEWPTFISSYEESTKICGYSDNENLIRLQKALRGTARDMVKSLLTSSLCVNEIIETLQMLFGRPEQIIENQLEEIRRFPALRDDKLESFVRFAVLVKNLRVTMTTAKLNSHLKNPMLLKELVNKLTPALKFQWIQVSLNDDNDDITKFERWLNQISKNVCEKIPDLRINENFPRTVRNEKREFNKGRQSSNLNVHETKIISSTATPCMICNANCKSVTVCAKFKESSEDEKWNLIRANKLCKQCLKSHPMKAPFICKNAIHCNVSGCNMKHHPLMHRFTSPNKRQNRDQQSNQSNDKERLNMTEHFTCNHQLATGRLSFRYIPVKVKNGDKEMKEFAFLDQGSDSTFIVKSLAEDLNLKGPVSTMCINNTDEGHRIENDSVRVSFTIKGVHEGAPNFTVADAQTLKVLKTAPQTLKYGDIVKHYPHLKGLPINGYDQVMPRILIGTNNWKMAAEVRTIMKDEGPIASKCALGWTIYACDQKIINQSIKSCNHHVVKYIEPQNDIFSHTDTDLHQLVKRSFMAESLGVQAPKESTLSIEEQRALEMLQTTTRRLDNHFQTGLLWKNDHVELPDNKSMALRRMHCLEKRLRNDPRLHETVHEQMKQYIEKGYARKLTTQELTMPQARTWYLPVFPVLNANKPGKVRLVFDAAAQEQGISLNSLLLKGPDQMPSMLGNTLRFRENKIAIVGDIKEMFHQVSVIPEDQHVQRFMYRQNEEMEPDTYVLQVLTFGATCSPSCAQYAKNTNAKEFEHAYPRAVDAIIRNHYVDDWLDGTPTVQETIELARQVRKIHEKGGFEIRNFKSNSKAVLMSLGEETQDLSFINMNLDAKDDNEKILGIWWNTRDDTFTFSLKFNKGNREILEGLKKPTKREVLRILASVYDLNGFIAHYTSFLKVLLRDIWCSNVNWDDTIEEEHCKRWFLWLRCLRQIEFINIPRYYMDGIVESDDLNIQLHIFVDSSIECSAAVAYLRFSNTKQVKVSLVMAKTKVAPIRIVSVPRLELTAAVLGSRIKKTIMQELNIKISTVTFWSDSCTTLSWIRSETRKMKGQFVAHRVAEIQQNTEVADWRYVPSKLNVADDATKWTKDLNISNDDRWFNGPPFLYQPEMMWPKDITIGFKTTDEMKSVNAHRRFMPVIEFERFSKWNRLIRTIAFVLKMICKKKETPKTYECIVDKLSTEEIKRAEVSLYQMIQYEYYYNEITQLKRQIERKEPQAVSPDSTIYRLSPFLDEVGIIRMKGRIDAAKFIPFETKKPIILPTSHSATKLLVMKYHVEYNHINHETVVNVIRTKYEIPRLRQLLKRIRSECSRCKFLRAKPIIPEMAALPRARLQPYSHAFTYVGVDCLGPITVAVGRRNEKRWICLFTCLVTRGVHLEILHKMDHDAFILAFRNFTQRRGAPREVYSDNGSNFVKGEKVLKEAMKEIDMKVVHSAFQDPELKWYHNPPESPHMGGAWERLVRSFKTAFYVTAPSRTLNDPLLFSYTIEIENTINSRPLTYLPLDSYEEEALTPNHFIRGSSDGRKPIGVFDDDCKLMKFNWMMSQLYAQKFWRRWISEYLPELTRRTKWLRPVEPLKEGDVVLIVDPNEMRNHWPKGVIEEVKMGNDGQVRSALVRTKTGHYERPAVKIAKLDIVKDGAAKEPEKLHEGENVANESPDTNVKV